MLTLHLILKWASLKESHWDGPGARASNEQVKTGGFRWFLTWKSCPEAVTWTRGLQSFFQPSFPNCDWVFSACNLEKVLKTSLSEICITELLKMKNEWGFCLDIIRCIMWWAATRLVLGFIRNSQVAYWPRTWSLLSSWEVSNYCSFN